MQSKDANLSSEVYETLLKTGDGGTLDVAFSIISWSFNALLTGKWPTHDWKGERHFESLIGCFFVFPLSPSEDFCLHSQPNSFSCFSSACFQPVGIHLRVHLDRRQADNLQVDTKLWW